MSHHRGTTAAPRTFNRYPTAPDGRGATVPTRATPVGKDPLAVDAGKNDVQASLEYLAAKRRG